MRTCRSRCWPRCFFLSLRDPNAPELGRATHVDLARRVLGHVALAPLRAGGSVSAAERDWIVAMNDIKRVPVLRRLVPWRAIPVGLVALGIATFIGLGM